MPKPSFKLTPGEWAQLYAGKSIVVKRPVARSYKVCRYCWVASRMVGTSLEVPTCEHRNDLRIVEGGFLRCPWNLGGRVYVGAYGMRSKPCSVLDIGVRVMPHTQRLEWVVRIRWRYANHHRFGG